MRRNWLRILLVLVVAAVMVFAASSVAAQGDDKEFVWVETDDVGFLMRYNDGRINAFDVHAPVAIYYTTSSTPVLDANGNIRWGSDGLPMYKDVITGVEMWEAHTDGTVSYVGYVPIADIEAGLTAAVDAEVQIATVGAYTLNASPSGWLWLAGPAGGCGWQCYTFQWELPS